MNEPRMDSTVAQAEAVIDHLHTAFDTLSRSGTYPGDALLAGMLCFSAEAVAWFHTQRHGTPEALDATIGRWQAQVRQLAERWAQEADAR